MSAHPEPVEGCVRCVLCVQSMVGWCTPFSKPLSLCADCRANSVTQPDGKIAAMNFGPSSADLAPGARNAVDVCLAITPEDRVALIADEPSREVAASIAAALDRTGARWDGVLIEAVTTRPMTAAPAPILEALERADA